MSVKLLAGFVLCVLSFTASAGVVKVSSVYQDLSNSKRQLKVTGSGLIFGFEGRQFVFTASHVSQGSDAQILLNEIPLKIEKRMLHAKSDLELFEVSGGAPAAIHAQYVDGRIAWNEGVSLRRWIDRFNAVAMQPWIGDPQLQVDNVFGNSRTSVLELNVSGLLLNGETLVQPGTSGAPLLTTIPSDETLYDVREGFRGVPAGKTFVRGIAIRRDRFFAHASFVPFLQMNSLFQSFLAGKEPVKLKQWMATDTILFRKAKVHIETASVSSATAGGVMSDAGNGVSIDGGDIATLGEDTPQAFLKKVSAFPRTGDAAMLYWSVGVGHPEKQESFRFYTWFDMEIYPMAAGIAVGYQDAPDFDYVKLLSWRLGHEEWESFELKSPASLRVNNKGLRIQIDNAEDEHFVVNLDRGGKKCGDLIPNCPTSFVPVIEVASSKMRKYIVDLRELFISDLATISAPCLRGPASVGLTDLQIQSCIYDSLKGAVVVPRLKYRLAKPSGAPLTTEQGQRGVVEWRKN